MLTQAAAQIGVRSGSHFLSYQIGYINSFVPFRINCLLPYYIIHNHKRKCENCSNEKHIRIWIFHFPFCYNMIYISFFIIIYEFLKTNFYDTNGEALQKSLIIYLYTTKNHYCRGLIIFARYEYRFYRAK